MKVKTSITLSGDVLAAIDRVIGKSKNRSAFIENLIRDHIEKRAKKLQEDKDLEILNKNSDRLNREAEDVLSYQVEL
jgi:metal-responsive CopG/Arc/MetJ family transcriptional regulator